MKLYLDCSSLTNDHISGIGIYNKNIFLELQKWPALKIIPALKLSRMSKSRVVQKHLASKVSLLPPIILDKNSLYHGTDHRLNAFSRGPRIVTIHDMQPFEGKWLDPRFAQKRRLIIERTLSSSVEKIIAVSHFTKNEILKYYPQLDSKIEVVYHGYDFKNQENEDLNRLPDLLEKRPFLLFIGNIEERKNLINQIIAFELLKKEYSELQFLIAGNPGFNHERILSYIHQSPFRDSIHLTGYLSESEKVYALKKTVCLMFASMYEGFGIPVIEALSYNSNVLISKASALTEIAGEYCHSANPLMIDDIVDKTKYIMEKGNKKEVDLISFKENWSWKKSASETLNVYQKLI